MPGPQAGLREGPAWGHHAHLTEKETAKKAGQDNTKRQRWTQDLNPDLIPKLMP